MPNLTHFRLSLVVAAPLMLLALVLACEGSTLDPAPQPITDARRLYSRLRLNHHAVTLSTTPPYDTLTLTATPENGLGEPLTGLAAPQYTSTVLDVAQVGADGVLRAIAPGLRAKVAVSLTYNNVTHTDTMLVDVVNNPNPPVLATFSVQPIPPDSAKTAVRSRKILTVHARDANGNPLSLTTHLGGRLWSNGNVFEVPGLTVGTFTFHASTTAFGVTKTDTLTYRIGLPVYLFVGVNPDSTGRLPAPRVGTGAAVGFVNTSATDTISITFTDPTKVAAPDPLAPSLPIPSIPWGVFCSFGPSDCGSGNVGLLPPGGEATRIFPVPGTYEFQSGPGVSGRIVVVDES